MALVKAGDGQSIYPLLSIDAKGDTTLTITLSQLQKVNIQLVGLDQCSESSDTLLNSLFTCEQIAQERKQVIEDYSVVVAKQDSIISNHEKIVQQKDEIFSITDSQHLKYEKKLKRTIFGWKVAYGGTLALIIAGLILL